MSQRKAAPSGKVYRPLFEAQAQLSRCLLARRRDRRTECPSAEDSKAHCSTASSRRQQSDIDEDMEEVRRLPDTVESKHSSPGFLERLMEKRSKRHEGALQQMKAELRDVSQVCETQVTAACQELLSSLEQVDLRLDTLKDKMKQQDVVSLQQLDALWQQVQSGLQVKTRRIEDLKKKLSENEAQRTSELRLVLRTCCQQLETIGFLSPPEIHRLMFNHAMMLNQALLANRRSVARLVLNLQVKKVEEESLLRLRWEESQLHWRTSRVGEVVESFRDVCSSNKDQQLFSGQQTVQEMKQTQQDLTERRQQIIQNVISSLVPPSCSTALVSDWFSQLTAVNQEIDTLHVDLLHQLRCCYDQTRQDRQSEVERCREELSALQLSEDEVDDIVGSQLLILTERSQSEDDQRLSALNERRVSVGRHAVSLSGSVFVVMQAAALLWETHSSRLERRKEELKKDLNELKKSQQLHAQEEHLDKMLAQLRQESSEDALKTSLDKTVNYLEDVKRRYSWTDANANANADFVVSVSDRRQLLDRLRSVCQEELVSYRNGLLSFFHLSHASGLENRPISCQNDTDPAQPAHDWHTKAERALLDLYDISDDVRHVFKSSRGVSYTGPAFRCPALNLEDNLLLNLSQFPAELLTHTLTSTRDLFIEHLEQHFEDVLRSAVAMAADRERAERLELLERLNPENIQTHIYQPRLAELQLHGRRVDAHCEEMVDVLKSCRVELEELQTSISRENEKFSSLLSDMGKFLTSEELESDIIQGMENMNLQDHLVQHMKRTQSCVTSFRETVQIRLEEIRNKTTQLLNSFRLFSEGGDFAPEEKKLFQRRLKRESRRIAVTEKSFLHELEKFQSKTLQQVKTASSCFEEKFNYMKSEVKFTETIQRIIGSTKVQIKAELVQSNQQQLDISSRLTDLRRLMKDTEVSPDQVCPSLASVNEDLMKRCQYLDFSREKPAAPPEPSQQVQSVCPALVQRLRRHGLEESFIEMMVAVKRICVTRDGPAEADQTGRRAAGQSLDQQSAETDNTPRGRRCIRNNRTFLVFGPEPEENPQSLSSVVNNVLWKANDTILQVAKDFYEAERSGLSWSHCLPLSLDHWAERTLQRLLGLEEQTRKFLNTSRKELVQQLSECEKLMCSLPPSLVSNHERQQGASLSEEAGSLRQELEETLAASEKEKSENFRQLRVSMTDAQLETVNSREELRQQQLHDAICSAHLQLQKRVRVRGEEFVTSLASLTENLLLQLDKSPAPAETETVETGAETGQRPRTVGRTWPGISYLSSPNSTADPPSSVATAMTPSITSSRCTQGHLNVIEQRDAAVKRFQQIFTAELSRSAAEQTKQLQQLQNWISRWRRETEELNRVRRRRTRL